MIRTVVYTRVDPGAGLDEPCLAEKLALLSEYATSHDMTVKRILAERNSGLDINRESIQEIRQWLWGQEIDCLLMADDKDPGDDPLLLEMLREEAEDCGASVVIANI